MRNPLLRAALSLICKAKNIVEWIACPWLTQLALRLALATPFWRSGILKWDGFFQLNEDTVELFTSELQLQLPGGPFPFPAPAMVALLSACAEVGLPVLLVFGLGTRFAATALLIMTGVIELTAPNGWPTYLTWAAMALGIAAWGPGAVSADYLLGDRLPRGKT